MALTPPLSEPQLRRYLAAHLDLIEPGLSLLKEEHRVTNEHGADGSIDILARDTTGDLVVIELKRSDQTARQALHEMEKYVALLATDQGVRIDRLRCVLLSTNWHELLVPFTRFVGHADFYVVGRLLLLGTDGLPVGSEVVQLPELDAGLDACPLHLHLLFANRERRDAVARGVVETLHATSIEDFITFDLNLATDDERVLYPHGTSLVLAEFSEALRNHIRALFPEYCEDESDSQWWHEQVVQAEVVRTTEADEVRVLTPRDFSSFADWDIGRLTGHGRYVNKAVWTENELERVVRADGEAFSPSFHRTLTVANKAAWTRTRGNLDRVIEGCGTWPETVSALLDELEQRPNAQVSVHVYAPADVLLGLEALVRLENAEYLPQLVIEWSDGAFHRLIGGRLTWDGTTRVRSLEETVGVIFPDFFGYIAASSTGAIREHETQLTALHGLRYDIVEQVERGEPETQRGFSRVTVVDGVLTRAPLTDDEPDGAAFVAAHEDYLAALAAAFAATMLRM